MKNSKVSKIVLSLIFSVGFAKVASADVFIGGVVSSDGKTPTGRECPTSDEGGEGFKCGSIFSSTCIALEPHDTLTKRCYNASLGMKLISEDYQAELPELKAKYDEVCQDKESSINKPGCLYIAKRIAQRGKSKDFAKIILSSKGEGTPVDAKPAFISITKAQKKLMEGTCANDYDKSAKYDFFGLPSSVAPFTLDENNSACNAKRNNYLLDKVAKSGCDESAKQDGNKLITTHIRPEHGNECLYGKTCYDFIIEQMNVKEHAPKQTTYLLTVLKPDASHDPAILVRQTLELLVKDSEYGKKYSLIGADGDETAIDIANSARLNLTKKYGENPSTVLLQDNCALAKAMADNSLHGATPNSNPSSGQGSK